MCVRSPGYAKLRILTSYARIAELHRRKFSSEAIQVRFRAAAVLCVCWLSASMACIHTTLNGYMTKASGMVTCNREHASARYESCGRHFFHTHDAPMRPMHHKKPNHVQCKTHDILRNDNCDVLGV